MFNSLSITTLINIVLKKLRFTFIQLLFVTNNNLYSSKLFLLGKIQSTYLSLIKLLYNFFQPVVLLQRYFWIFPHILPQLSVCVLSVLSGLSVFFIINRNICKTSTFSKNSTHYYKYLKVWLNFEYSKHTFS